MLKQEENELITQVGPGTPMGNFMREYWMPALLSSELPSADSDPLRVLLLGDSQVTNTGTLIFTGNAPKVIGGGTPNLLTNSGVTRVEGGAQLSVAGEVAHAARRTVASHHRQTHLEQRRCLLGGPIAQRVAHRDVPRRPAERVGGVRHQAGRARPAGLARAGPTFD